MKAPGFSPWGGKTGCLVLNLFCPMEDEVWRRMGTGLLRIVVESPRLQMGLRKCLEWYRGLGMRAEPRIAGSSGHLCASRGAAKYASGNQMTSPRKTRELMSVWLSFGSREPRRCISNCDSEQWLCIVCRAEQRKGDGERANPKFTIRVLRYRNLPMPACRPEAEEYQWDRTHIRTSLVHP
jgi:hypothetical protein